jgi:hypothetical protein
LNQSEQIQRVAVILNATANGQLQRALAALGWTSPAERGLICKQAGVSAGQFTEWLDGRWCPPTDQLLVLQQAALDYHARSLGFEPVAASNGASHG